MASSDRRTSFADTCRAAAAASFHREQSRMAKANGDVAKEPITKAEQLDSLTVAAGDAGVSDKAFVDFISEVDPFRKHVKRSRLLNARPYPLAGQDLARASQAFDRQLLRFASSDAQFAQDSRAEAAANTFALRKMEDMLLELRDIVQKVAR